MCVHLERRGEVEGGALLLQVSSLEYKMKGLENVYAHVPWLF